MEPKFQLIGHRIFESYLNFPKDLILGMGQGRKIQYDYKLDVHAQESEDKSVVAINVIGTAYAAYADEVEKGEAKPIQVARVNIEGGFSTEYNDCSEDVKRRLHFINAPAILLPYLRAFMTSLMAQANLPLIYFPVHNLVDRYNNTKITKSEA